MEKGIKELSPEDASLLAILAGNPRYTHWERLVKRIVDPIAKQAAMVIVGRQEGVYPSEAVELAESVLRWAERNREYMQKNSLPTRSRDMRGYHW